MTLPALLLPALLSVADDTLPPVRYPALAATAADAAGFAPPGWTLETRASGDLDGDGRPDLVLVLHMADKANVIANKGLCGDTLDTNPRILAVALARAEGGYRLVVQNHRLIPRRDNACAEDWLDPEGVVGGGVGIERGAVIVRLGRFMSAGSWGMGSTRFAFRWREGALRLVGFDSSDTQRNSGETTTLSVNYLSRRARIEQGSIEGGTPKVRWTPLKPAPLPAIDALGNGLEYDPDGLAASL